MPAGPGCPCLFSLGVPRMTGPERSLPAWPIALGWSPRRPRGMRRVPLQDLLAANRAGPGWGSSAEARPASGAAWSGPVASPMGPWAQGNGVHADAHAAPE